MFKRILVPVDGSETSTKALVAALELARNTGGRVRILHSLDELAYVSGFDYGADLMRIARDQAGKVLGDALDVARSAGIPADSRLVEAPGQRLGEVVADEAQVWEADLIVVGTHGRRGVSRTLLGSGAEQVIRLAPVPVLSIRGSDEGEPR
ncbi:MAG TPA: universal stress protein [Ramlibacter sp.]|nr:universal stress protein [Ramlibacter sp.]